MRGGSVAVWMEAPGRGKQTRKTRVHLTSHSESNECTGKIQRGPRDRHVGDASVSGSAAARKFARRKRREKKQQHDVIAASRIERATRDEMYRMPERGCSPTADEPLWNCILSPL